MTTNEANLYRELDLPGIIAYCQGQGPEAIAWLKETSKKKVPYKVYPRIKVDGKMKVDKTQEPKIEMRPISFVQLKMEFLEHFHLVTAKEKKKTMYEIIDAL